MVVTLGACAAEVSVESTERFSAWYNSKRVKRPAIDTHEATWSNTSGGETTLDLPDGNGRSGRVVQLTQNTEVGSGNGHVAGVRYDSAAKRWVVGHVDGAGVPVGSAYNVSVGSGGFVHTTSSSNLRGHVTVLDKSSLNGKPNKMLWVTQDLSGSSNPHAIGVSYDNGKWQVYNEDFSSMPSGARFHVRVAQAGESYFTHTTNFGNTLFNWTYLNHPLLNDQPDAQFLVTHNYSPGGATFGNAFDSPVGVAFDEPTGLWMILTQDFGGMSYGVSFNVLISP